MASGGTFESRDVLAADTDRWWSVTPDFPTEPVAGEVVSAIEEFVLPAMRTRMSQVG